MDFDNCSRARADQWMLSDCHRVRSAVLEASLAMDEPEITAFGAGARCGWNGRSQKGINVCKLGFRRGGSRN